MRALNNVILQGRLVKDAELKYTTESYPVVSFTLAHNNSWKDKTSGDWKEVAYFFDCVWYGKRAENDSKILVKGTPVIVQGSLKQEKWTDRDGNNHSIIRLNLDSVNIISEQKNSSEINQKQFITAPEPDHFDDDGIPF